MLKLFFFGLGLLLIGYVLLESRVRQRTDDKPVFLRTDTIARAHNTQITIRLHTSRHRPSDVQLDALKTDYANLWAHLNHLYATNEVETGKEYYTEGWFKQICRHYRGKQPSVGSRSDLRHDLHLQNWSSDGLVCTAIDSNVVLTYHLRHQPALTTRATIAVALLYQGDHWRIDAMRVLQESTIDINSTRL